MTDNNKLFWLIITVISGWLLYQLSSVLAPFFIAALLAYLADPIVDMLERRKLSRTLSVTVVFIVLLLVTLLILLVFLPLIVEQLASLFKRLPDYVLLLQSILEPWLASVGFPIELLDATLLKQTLSNYGSEVGKVASSVMNYMTRSGIAMLQWMVNLILIPVLTFYLLRDWDVLLAKCKTLLPQRYAQKAIELSSECDEMLAAFIRGQLMVMLVLAAIYTVGLAMIGIELALLLGVIAGIVSFVPYLGLIVGISLAGMAAFFQFHEWLPVLMVVAVFSVAQMIEAVVLTPRFVGERIGLHPVAVIFAVMAGGQLFAFVGVLLALPIAAVMMVLLRYAHQQYLASQLSS